DFFPEIRKIINRILTLLSVRACRFHADDSPYPQRKEPRYVMIFDEAGLLVADNNNLTRPTGLSNPSSVQKPVLNRRGVLNKKR
ncbi:hypothetical protein DPJ95_25695, partial [Salmonella enterica subsp. enterica serovar Oranienburg]|nr:hypothetical protein [Salmonella enterica subsp. enterica serovar Oranienburg]